MPYQIHDLILDIEVTSKGISRIRFIDPMTQPIITKPENPLVTHCLLDIHQFLTKTTQTFSTPIDLSSGTDFQQKVWRALLDIPYGQTCSYKDIAIKINQPKAYQAVGQACKKNPVPIIVPCHRVISQSGKLTGYFGTSDFGLAIKKSLITLEKGNHE